MCLVPLQQQRKQSFRVAVVARAVVRNPSTFLVFLTVPPAGESQLAASGGCSRAVWYKSLFQLKPCPHGCEYKVGLAPEFPEKLDLLVLSERMLKFTLARAFANVGSVLLSP